ncbi:hypothetical protein COOONC_04661 [Cooperia oncophora]
MHGSEIEKLKRLDTRERHPDKEKIFEMVHLPAPAIGRRRDPAFRGSTLRDTQDYCTDSECLTDGGPTAIASNSILLWTMLWGFLALVLFFMRPNSMRGNSNRNEKPGPSNDRNNQPPPPAIM